MHSICLMPITNTIVPRHIGRYLSRTDNIVDADTVFCMRERDGNNRSTKCTKLFYRAFDLSSNSIINPIDKIFCRYPYPYTTNVLLFPYCWIEFCIFFEGSGIMCIISRSNLIEHSCITNSPGKISWTIK